MNFPYFFKHKLVITFIQYVSEVVIIFKEGKYSYLN